MSEVEQTAPVAEADSTAVEAVPTEQAVASPSLEPEKPSWLQAFEEAPADELRNHPKFKGILGSELESRRRSWESDHVAVLRQQEAERLQQEALELADKDPDAFAEKFKTDVLTLRQRQEASQAGVEQTRLMGRMVGDAARQLPEWGSFTPADHEAFYVAVAAAEAKATAEGRDPRAAAVGAFQHAVSDRAAEVRATQRHAQWKQTDMAKAVAAAKQEWEATSLLNGDRPEAARVRGNGAVSDEPDWRKSPAEWERWTQAQDAAATRARLMRSR